MESVTAIQLREIGRQLDQRVFPRVTYGGIVMPGDSVAPLSNEGAENGDESRAKRTTEGQRGSTAGSRQGTSRWQGSTGGSWAPGETTSIFSADLRARYESELKSIDDAYPGARVWHQGDGFWIRINSGLLRGSPKTATFVAAASYELKAVRSWGFWNVAGRDLRWIGPRHTNSPDGSICAFEPADKTWLFGEPLVELLDIYTLWALRHLHLEWFGRWPGEQSVRFPFERVMELRADELCGCGGSPKLYSECCMRKDLSRNRLSDALAFFRTFGARKPPHAIPLFAREESEPPPIGQLVSLEALLGSPQWD